VPQHLTPLDEWPRHQLPTTFDVVGSDSPHWSDGYYFTLGDAAGTLRLFTAIRLYANNDVADGYACASTGGRQHNLRVSRRLRPAIDELRVGPLELEILQPLQELRTTCAENEYGVSYDLTWRGVHEPYLEDYVEHVGSGRHTAKRCNYGQACDVEGWVEVAGQRHQVGGDDWVGIRDHSWGLGRTGGPRWPHAAPLPADEERLGFALRSWSMFRFPDRVVFWQFHLDDDGQLTMFEQRTLPRSDAPAWSASSASIEVETVPGHRRVRRALVTLFREEGSSERFEVEMTGDPTYLQGAGYWSGFDDGLGRGVYRGDDHREGEVWDVSDPSAIGDPKGLVRERQEAWAQTFATCRALDAGDTLGVGHFECVLAGDQWL
jgi:hypothetical protein